MTNKPQNTEGQQAAAKEAADKAQSTNFGLVGENLAGAPADAGGPVGGGAPVMKQREVRTSGIPDHRGTVANPKNIKSKLTVKDAKKKADAGEIVVTPDEWLGLALDLQSQKAGFDKSHTFVTPDRIDIDGVPVVVEEWLDPAIIEERRLAKEERKAK